MNSPETRIRFAPRSHPTRRATHHAATQAAMPTLDHPQALPTLLQPPRGGSLLAQRTSAASPWSSAALPRPPGPSSSPELIPATEGPQALRGIQPHPGLHPPPLSPPSRPLDPAPAEAGARQGVAGRGRERLAPGWPTPRPHALYLSGALLPPPGRLRSTSVRRALAHVRTRTWLDTPSRGDYGSCTRTRAST